ncbi:hypothetical protein WA026_018070 [Henosepilachna vigintioctopunctata]|uniref:Uncharacterized protein n=1 Tax=Henosepilachna vigintioctopunctata TaxID=420089 RepID=A0AAW1UM31_9CUCU
MNILLVQQNFRNKRRFSNPIVSFNFPSFSSGDNQISCLHTINKIIVLVNNFHDSKISFLQMMTSRKDIDKLYIHCVDVEVLTSKCRILCTMKGSTQLDYSRHILFNVSGISKLFQCILRDYIFYSRIVSLNRIHIADKFKIKPAELIKYSMYSTEIPNCLLNQEETNSLEHLEESFKNIPTALVLQMWPRCSPTTENQIQNETVENYQLFGMAAQLGIFETMKIVKRVHNQHKIRKMKRGHQKKNLLKNTTNPVIMIHHDL